MIILFLRITLTFLLTSLLDWKGLISYLYVFGVGLLIISPLYFLSSLNYISLILIILTWRLIQVIIINERGIGSLLKKINVYWKVIFFLFLVLRAFFLTNNIMILYLRFEASLLPIIMLILGWGYQPERFIARLRIALYIIFSSLPILLLLVEIVNSFSIFTLEQLRENRIIKIESNTWAHRLISLFFSLRFLVKFPIFLVHMWLPKAHVEAPISGSIILAGVLLKIGGYGMFLLSPIIFRRKLRNFFSILALGGGAWASFICLRQIDLKILIAYFSVAHIRVCVACLLKQQILGRKGLVIILFSHGACSAGLFLLAYIIYLHTNSRNMLLRRGRLNYVPFFSKLVFLILIRNIGTPPTLNFVGEIFCYRSLLRENFFLALPSFILLLLGIVVRVFLYINTQYGEWRGTSYRSSSRCVVANLSLNIFIFLVFFVVLILRFIY